MKLVFGKANAKLKKLQKRINKKVYTFSLLSGHSCPYAKICKSMAIKVKGKMVIQDGKDTEFRCYSASTDSRLPVVYKTRKHNMQIVKLAGKSISKAVQQLNKNIPKNAKVIRIHEGGDFQTQAYFDTWLQLAINKPDIIFYAYTKSIPFWVKRLEELNNIPNLILTGSFGGYKDDLILKHKLRFSKVVYSKKEAKVLGLNIDHDDFHAYNPKTKDKPFALLIHGIQPAGSMASKALVKLQGVGSHGR